MFSHQHLCGGNAQQKMNGQMIFANCSAAPWQMRFYASDSAENNNNNTAAAAESSTRLPNPSSLNITIIGSTGALGQSLIKKLSPLVKSITAVSSGAEFSNLQQRDLPHYDGNVKYVQYDITDAQLDFEFLNGQDIVINTANCWIERDHSYKEIFVDGTKHLAFHAKRCGVSRFVQLGALGSFVDSPAPWLDYKYRAEDMAFAAFPDVTIVRPGIMFGQDATVFNHVLKRMALMPVVIAPHSLVNVQPVSMEDVSEAVKRLVLEKTDAEVHNTVWDLGGPQYYPLADLVRSALSAAGKKRPVFSSTLATLMWEGILGVTQMLPGAKVPRDFLIMMKHEWARTYEDGWVVSGHLVEESDKHFTFKDLGMEPRPMEEEVAEYFGASAPKQQVENVSVAKQ